MAQPVYYQAPPGQQPMYMAQPGQPMYAQPGQPMYAQPPPQQMYAPAPQPGYAPAPQPMYAPAPGSQPMYAPQPMYAQPAPQPMYAQPPPQQMSYVQVPPASAPPPRPMPPPSAQSPSKQANFLPPPPPAATHHTHQEPKKDYNPTGENRPCDFCHSPWGVIKKKKVSRTNFQIGVCLGVLFVLPGVCYCYCNQEEVDVCQRCHKARNDDDFCYNCD